jgi:hypothetical protein
MTASTTSSPDVASVGIEVSVLLIFKEGTRFCDAGGDLGEGAGQPRARRL